MKNAKIRETASARVLFRNVVIPVYEGCALEPVIKMAFEILLTTGGRLTIFSVTDPNQPPETKSQPRIWQRAMQSIEHTQNHLAATEEKPVPAISVNLKKETGEFRHYLKQWLEELPESPLILWPGLADQSAFDPLRQIRNKIFNWGNSPVLFIPPDSKPDTFSKIALLIDFRFLNMVRSAHHIALELANLLNAKLEIIWLADKGNRQAEDLEFLEEILDWEKREWVSLIKYTGPLAQLNQYVADREYDLVTITHYRHQAMVDWRGGHPSEPIRFQLQGLPFLIFQRN